MPLVGVAYWTLALYLLPFAHGLDLAAALIGVLAVAACARGAWTPAWKRFSWATLILVIGSLPYATTLLYHYVPFGMDGSMHTTAATLIARSGGLPGSHAPFAADVSFPPMNLGLPTVAGIAIRWGAEPAAAMLACHHLTFTLLILASYLLLRSWTGRMSSALLAVVTVWTARASQASLQWGGFPTVMSVAVGIFAARLLLQQIRSTHWRLSLATGAAIAAIPLMHGIGGGTWLYCVGPWIAVATLLQARGKLLTLRSLTLSGACAALFLALYRFAGPIDVQTRDMEWTQQWQQQAVPLGDNALLSAFDYIRKDAGSFVVLAGWTACGVLAIRRQWPAVLLLAAAWLALLIVVVNSHYWFLPASFLLYPERAIYWAGPLSAVGLALAVRIPTRSASEGNSHPSLALRVGMVFGLLCLAGYYQNQFYQKIVREDFVNADGWEALVWAKQHLRPEHDFVRTTYNSTGSFLPAIAQVGCNGAHHHHFIERQVHDAYGRRTVTHVLLDQALAPGAAMAVGTVVFRNRTITIVALDRFAGELVRSE